jgi:hypothetical protein
LELWKSDHDELKDADQLPIEETPAAKHKKPSCLDAGVCICGDDGDLIFKFKKWLLRGIVDGINECKAVSKLTSACIIVRLSRCAEFDDKSMGSLRTVGSGPLVGVNDTFLFVGLMYLSPKRPTFREVNWPCGHVDVRGFLHLRCTDVYWNIYEYCASVRGELQNEWVMQLYELYTADEPLRTIDTRQLKVRLLCSAPITPFGRKTATVKRKQKMQFDLDALPDGSDESLSDVVGIDDDDGVLGDASDDGGCGDGDALGDDLLSVSSSCTSNRCSDSSSCESGDHSYAAWGSNDSSDDSMVGLPVGVPGSSGDTVDVAIVEPPAIAIKVPATIVISLGFGTFSITRKDRNLLLSA